MSGREPFPKKGRDPARVARDRLLRLERQAKARAEAAAVADGVGETVALMFLLLVRNVGRFWFPPH